MIDVIDITVKICNKCKIEKSVSEFYKREHTKKGWRPSCKSCMKPYINAYRKTDSAKASARRTYQKHGIYWTDNRLFTVSKAIAKYKGRTFLLSFAEYFQIRNQPCYYCKGILLEGNHKGIGLDRIDNSRGYEIDNILPCCGFCNEIRSDKLSVDEMKKVAELLINLRKLSIL